MDHFLYRFCTFSEKLKKIYGLDWLSLNLLQNAPSKFVLLTLRLFVRWFQMPLERLSFVKTLPTSRIINATDSLIQNITRIVYLRWFTYDILSEEPWKPCCFIRANEVWLIFHFFSWNPLSVRRKSLKKIYRIEHFRANVHPGQELGEFTVVSHRHLNWG